MGSGGVNLSKDIPTGRITTDNYAVIYEFPDDIRVTFSHIYFDPPGFAGIKERANCSEGVIDLEQRGEIALEVPNAASARLSSLVSMLGARAIHEKRVVTWQEIASRTV